MNSVSAFLHALKVIATSPFSFIGYLAVVSAWAFLVWKSQRLRIISDRLKELPEKDRLKALQLEYQLQPKHGLDADAYLTYSRRQYLLAALIVTLFAVVVLFTITSYRVIEQQKLSTLMKSLETALDVTKIGVVSGDQTRFSQAAGALDAALKVYPSHRGFMNLAYVYDELGDTTRAIAAYEKAKELDPNDAETLNALGYLYTNAGQYDTAERFLKSAIANSTLGSDVWFMAKANLGILAYERGRATDNNSERDRYSKIALEQDFLPAMQYRGSIEDLDLIAKTLAAMGNAYKDTGQLDSAEKCLQEAIDIKRKLYANSSMADTLTNLADLRLKRGQYPQAEPLLIEAQQIYTVTGYAQGSATALYNLGDIAWVNKQNGSAASYYEQARQIFELNGIRGDPLRAAEKRLERLRANQPPDFVLQAWAQAQRH